MDEIVFYKSEKYPDYRFSKDGRVFTKYNSEVWREMKPLESKTKAYLRLDLKDKNGVFKKRLVHRVIAETFIPNPDELPCINHKDENPRNNSVENLEWCTWQYNNLYGTHFEKSIQGFLNASKRRRISIIGISENNEKVYFESESHAAKVLGRGKTTIRRHLKSKRPCVGYVLYREEEVI